MGVKAMATVGRWTDWRVRLNQRFKELKATEKLTQTQLAEILGVEQTAVSHWLSGKRTPNTLQQFEDLAKALRMPLIELLFGVNPSNIVDYAESADFAELVEMLPAPQRAALKSAVRCLVEEANLPESGPQFSRATKVTGKSLIPFRNAAA